jgi:hypothetical protein
VNIAEVAQKVLIKWRSYKREGKSICTADGSGKTTGIFKWLVIFFPAASCFLKLYSA